MTTTPQTGGPPSAAQDVPKLGLIRPPLVYLISIVTGLLIQRATPQTLVPRTLALPLGAFLILVAIVFLINAAAQLIKSAAVRRYG